MPPPGDDDVFTLNLNVPEQEPDDDDGTSAPIVPAGRRRKEARGQDAHSRGAHHLLRSMVTRVPRPRAKRLVVETYGKTSRGTPNVKDAAADLGVHPDTVRRWIRQGVPKKSAHAEQLRSKWVDSPAGRRASIGTERRKDLRARPGTSTVRGALTGFVWVDTDDPRNGEERSFNFTLNAEKTRELNQALMDGDDERALDILESNLDGFGSSGVEIDLTDVSWKNLR